MDTTTRKLETERRATTSRRRAGVEPTPIARQRWRMQERLDGRRQTLRRGPEWREANPWAGELECPRWLWRMTPVALAKPGPAAKPTFVAQNSSGPAAKPTCGAWSPGRSSRAGRYRGSTDHLNWKAAEKRGAERRTSWTTWPARKAFGIGAIEPGHDAAAAFPPGGGESDASARVAPLSNLAASDRLWRIRPGRYGGRHGHQLALLDRHSSQDV